MRKCDLYTGASRIQDALEKLTIVWQDNSDRWNDAVSQRFRETNLEPMVTDVKLALDSMGRMNSLMDEVQRDCAS